MKIRSAYYYSLLSIGVLGVLGLVCSPLVFGQEKRESGFAVARDSLPKKAAGGRAGDADPDDPVAAGSRIQPKPEEMPEPVAMLEFIETDLVTASQLLTKFGAQEDVTPLRDALEAMLDEGTAKLVETCYVRSTAGQRMKTESVREHIYPTQFSSPQVPKEFNARGGELPIVAGIPTAFDVRNVGTTLEIEMNVSAGEPGGRYISCNIAPQHVRYIGDRLVAPDGGAESKFQTMPEFAVMKVSTNVNALEGATSLLGLLGSNQDQEARTFVLLKMDLLKPGVPEVWDETEEESQRSKKIVTHLEYIELGHRQANQLLRRDWAQRDARRLRASLEELIEAGDAQLIETCYVKTTPGQRCKIESVREHLYPTEFSHPALPDKLTVDGTELRASDLSPVNFDVRNVGMTFEVEPNLGIYKVVSVNMAPEIVEYLGERPVGEDLPPELRNIKMPEFYKMGVQSSVLAFVGQYNLVNCFTPPGAPDKRVLLLMKVDVVR